MFNFNFDKACSTSHSIYLRRFRPKNGFCTHNQTEVEAIIFRSVYHQGIYQPYILFIFGFLWDNRISQNFFRLHSIYLRCSKPKSDFCIFIQTEVETVVFRSIIKVFINLTMYLSSNFYAEIKFLKNLSDYIVFIYIRLVFLLKKVKM